MSPRGRTRRRGRPALLAAILVLVSVVLAGCVEIPTSGPAEPIEGQAPPCQNCVNVEVDPPSYGDDPKQVVEGYLRATSVYQPNYSVARQFLTSGASEKWSPEDGAQIFSGALVASGASTVVLDGRLEASLGPDRSYSAQRTARRWNFGVVKEGGQWRISTPPPGLMVAEYYFTRFYSSYNLYFIGNATLVPDPIFLPNLPNQANVASVLMKALLNGPTRWLKPAVTSAIPADTALSVESVTVQDGVAEVPLSDAVLSLNDQQRSLLTAQVVLTLSQAAGIESVLFRVNQAPFRVPDSDEDTFRVPVDSIASDIKPLPVLAGEDLYAVRGRSVMLVDTAAGSPDPRPMAGSLGAGKFAVDSLAVSAGNTDIAVVTDGRTTLRTGTTTAGDPAERLGAMQNLLRPQYSRYGELWVVGEQRGRQRIWMLTGNKVTEVAAPLLADGSVTAFRISPDGTHIALLRTAGSRSELGVARITRSEAITVDGWLPLDTSQPNTPALVRFQDVGWLTANTLMTLGATTAIGSMMPYEVSIDASMITVPSEAKDWDPVELANLAGTDLSVVIDRQGRLYTDDGQQWRVFLTGSRTAAFPG